MMTELEKELLSALKVALRQFVPAVPPHDPNRHCFDQIKEAIKAAEAKQELKPWPSTEKAARDLGFNVDSPSWDEARKDWGLES